MPFLPDGNYSRQSTEQIALEKLRVQVSHAVSRYEMSCLKSTEFSSYNDVAIDSMVYQLRAYILGAEQKQEVTSYTEVPLTCIDAFKGEWLQPWLKRNGRFARLFKWLDAKGWLKRIGLDQFGSDVKVKTRRIDTVLRTWKVCPHLEIPGDHKQNTHIYWLAGKEMGPIWGHATCPICNENWEVKNGPKCPKCVQHYRIY